MPREQCLGFDEILSGPVILSAARVPAGRDERKSKDPEDVSSAIRLQGVLLKTAFQPCLPAAFAR